MLRLDVHIKTMLVARHVGTMSALLRGQLTTLVSKMPGEILFVRVGLLAAWTNVRVVRWRDIVQRGDRFHGYRPGVF